MKHESAYRFCFGKSTSYGANVLSKSYHGFSEKEISEFISAIIEKYDKYKVYFYGNKNVRFVTVAQLVSADGGAHSIKYRGEKFNVLFRYMNVQNLRSMFSILFVNKIPIKIHGKEYLVNYDTGDDPYQYTADFNIEQSCYLKRLNSGELKHCKDMLFFKAV